MPETLTPTVPTKSEEYTDPTSGTNGSKADMGVTDTMRTPSGGAIFLVDKNRAPVAGRASTKKYKGSKARKHTPHHMTLLKAKSQLISISISKPYCQAHDVRSSTGLYSSLMTTAAGKEGEGEGEGERGRGGRGGEVFTGNKS
jgi:hypothetical protein